MDENHQLLQRYLDGELDEARVRAAEQLMAGQPELRAWYQAQASNEQSLLQLAQPASQQHDDHLVRLVMSRVHGSARLRPPVATISFGHIAAVLCAAVIIALSTRLVGSAADLVPISVIATVAIAIGILTVSAAFPLWKDRPSLLKRLLQQRFSVTRYDAASLQTVGIILVVAGIWLLTR